MTKLNEPYSENYSLKRNTVNLFGPIDDQMAEQVISQIQYLDYNNAEEIILQINSPGGSVSAGLAIYDTLCFIKARVRTVAIGMAASMAAILLSAGSRGCRFASANSQILIHQPLANASGQASDIIIAANHIEQVRKRLNQILADNTGKPLRTIQRDTDRDKIMTAEEAKLYGIVDFVIAGKNKAKGE